MALLDRNPMQQKSDGRYLRWMIRVFLVLAVGGIVCSFWYLAYAKTPQARARRNSAMPLVGTWIGEHGNVINIRPDGTARSRPKSGVPEIQYFEWTFDPGSLAIYQYSRRYNLGWFAKRVMLDDRPTDRYEVMEVTPTAFKLRADTGDEIIFTAATDPGLEAAP